MKEIKLNSEITINLPKLIDSRLLVQANSGAGKSWLLRRILEQSHGKVQQIIIDLEGEFSTLREKYDYVLAGKGGDTPATPQSAALLARKLLELNVSAIIDLYELQHQDRKRFVRLFLDSMINAPKELWHPVMIVIDEAHVFVPEKGESEAAGAVIDLATRGRKRGFCVVLATQRISKLHKDAAAECNNKLIGRAAQDIDMKRSADELGFTSREQQLSLRGLEAGEFYAFGPAISNEVIKIKVGDVNTSHPKAGSRSLTSVVPPTEKIKKILGQLADLPAEARKEVETIQSLKNENTSLKKEVSVFKRENQVLKNRPPEVVTSMSVIQKAVKQALSKKQDDDLRFEKNLISENSKLRGILKDLGDQISKVLSHPNLSLGNRRPIEDYIPVDSKFGTKPTQNVTFNLNKIVPRIGLDNRGEITREPLSGEEKSVTGGALRMLKVLVSRHPIKLTKPQLATFSKLSPNSGTFGTYLSLLRSKGYILVDEDLYTATPEGIDFVGESPNPPQTTEETIEMWKNNLTGGSRRMFEVLVEHHPNEVSKEDLGQLSGLASSSGTFGTYLSILRSNGIVHVKNNMVVLSESLFI